MGEGITPSGIDRLPKPPAVMGDSPSASSQLRRGERSEGFRLGVRWSAGRRPILRDSGARSQLDMLQDTYVRTYVHSKPPTSGDPHACNTEREDSRERVQHHVIKIPRIALQKGHQGQVT